MASICWPVIVATLCFGNPCPFFTTCTIYFALVQVCTSYLWLARSFIHRLVWTHWCGSCMFFLHDYAQYVTHACHLLLDLLLCNSNRYIYSRWTICICTSDTFACCLLYCIGICRGAWLFDPYLGRNTCRLAAMSWRTTCIRLVFFKA